jgi:hypothetical protein
MAAIPGVVLELESILTFGEEKYNGGECGRLPIGGRGYQ